MKHYTVFSVLLGAAILLQPSPSWGQGCCGQTLQAIKGSTTKVLGAVNFAQKETSSAIANTINALKDVQVDMAGKIADDKFQKDIGLVNAKAAAEAERNHILPGTSTCGTVGTATYAIGGREKSAMLSMQYEGDLIKRNLATPSSSVAAMRLYKEHIKKYCGEASAFLSRCNKSSDMPDADISAQAFLRGGGPAGKASSYTYNEQQIEAGQAYTRSVINALPQPALNMDEEKTEAGQAYISMRLANEARLSLASKPFNDALAARSPVMVNGKKLGTYIRGIWERMANQGINVPIEYFEELDKNGNNASFQFVLQTEVDRRFANPGWLAEMAEAEPPTRETEQIFMDSLALFLMMEQYKQQEDIKLLLGGIYAEIVNNSQEQNRMQAQYKEAIKAASRNRK